MNILCWLGIHKYTEWHRWVNAKYETRFCKRCYHSQKKGVI